MSNLGPLPTDFTLPPKCASELLSVYKLHTGSPDSYYVLQGPWEQTTCYPNSYSGNPEQYYSPARCPIDFTTACDSTNTIGALKETIVACCPTVGNYECNKDAQYLWQTTLGCVSRVIQSRTELFITEISKGTTSRIKTTLISDDGFNAYQIQVRYQSTDFVVTTTTSSLTPSSIQHSSTSDLTQETQSAVVEPKRITGGAIAGIVVGAVAAVIIILVAVFLLLRRYRRRRRSNIIPQHRQEPEKQLPAHPPVTHELGVYERPAELVSESMSPSTQFSR
ncbi:hypothetical protein F5Y10DRAFT_236206 [Nemania abortiva]|nr:hypothetical protein F5Y10DRAFT_236206 [Nemania abortiva]